MIIGEYVSLREAGDMLGLELWRVARLGRYLGIDSGEKLLPHADVERIRAEPSPEKRYDAVRCWLLAAFHRQRDACG